MGIDSVWGVEEERDEATLRVGQSVPKLRFLYDALGNRVVKEYVPGRRREIYARDAQGNVLAVYEAVGESLLTKEYYIWGVQRLGYLMDRRYFGRRCSRPPCIGGPPVPVQRVLGLPPGIGRPSVVADSVVELLRGSRRYELSDWLGNVRVVVTDRRLGSLRRGYRAEVVGVGEYYSFGGRVGERSYEVGRAYRWGFNGQEVVGELGRSHYTARYWEYDGRLGRRWEVDPKGNSLVSVYAVLQCNPIWSADIDGDTIRIVTREGKYLFSLDDGRATVMTMSAKEAYDRGIQWFEPEADNYMPLVHIAPDITSIPALRHFSWSKVAAFAQKDRWMVSYRQGGEGDWKASEEGAQGYFLVTVNGFPYWADAIGQIPFAVDYFTDIYEETGDKELSIRKTLRKGQEYGEGKLLGGRIDRSNTYDNYFLLRGTLWASKRYRLVPGSGWFGDKYDLEETDFHPNNLAKPISKEEAIKYGLK